jgi:hypothetical protein
MRHACEAPSSYVDYVWCIMPWRVFDFWCSIEPVWNLAAQLKYQILLFHHYHYFFLNDLPHFMTTLDSSIHIYVYMTMRLPMITLPVNIALRRKQTYGSN